MRRWKVWLALAAGSLALFAFLGFVVAPPFVKARLIRELSKRLGREVSVGAVAVNPFELSLTLSDLKIADTDGKPFASWDRAELNYRFTSLLSRDFVFDAMIFDKPYARFVMNADGSLNIDDLLKIFRAAPAEGSSSRPAVWRFEAVRVHGAKVGVTDRVRSPEFETTVGPFELNLDRFSTSPNSESPYGFQGRTDAGETFAWQGRITSNPLKSSGELTLGGVKLPKYRPYYQTDRAFEVREGTVDLRAAYDLAWSATERLLRVKGANLTLADAVIGRPGIEEPDINVNSLKVENATVDLLTRAAAIDRIALEGGRILIRHDPAAGGVNLHQMIQPFMEGPPASGSPAARPPAPVTVGALEVRGITVDAEDRKPARPFKVTAHDVSVSVTGISNAPGTMCPATLSSRFGDAGRVDVSGTFAADGHGGDLDVDVADVDIRPTDSYLDPVVRARIASGSVSAKGHVKFELPDDGAMVFSYKGDLRVKNAALVHADTAQDLFRIAVFQIRPLAIGLNPMTIAAGEVAIGAPQLRVAIAPDRSIDLADVFVRAPEGEAAAKPGPLPKTTIDTVRLQNGSIRLDDRSVEPNVAMSISKLSGTVKGISTDELSRANVEIEAMLDGVAPLSLQGQINPIARKDFTDLKLTLKGLDLLPYAPYSGKYLGYGIGKGKLAADLSYKISQRRFTSTNVFTIEQFALGDKVASEDALRVPVKLAVAVLRDRNGQIVLDVPAEGSVDDPDFRLGKVIVRAIVNVLTKIVTSPFRLLANAFGGGRDVNVEFQEFAPGSSALAPSETQKLDVVAKSLLERPDLSLDVQGTVEPESDTGALKKARLDGLVRTLHFFIVTSPKF